MYKKEVRIGKYKYTYYYYNIKIKGKVKNICLGRDKQEALQKIKEINKKRKKIREMWNDDFYKKLTLSILIMFSMIFFLTQTTEVIATPGLTLYYLYPPENTENTTSRHPDFTINYTSTITPLPQLNCSIFITGVNGTFVYKTNSSVNEYEPTTMRNRRIHLPDGTNYTWGANCTDRGDNTTQGPDWAFNITLNAEVRGVPNGSTYNLSFDDGAVRPVDATSGLLGYRTTTGDLNGDEYDDVISSAPDVGRVYIWYGNGSALVNGSAPDVTLDDMQFADYGDIGSSLATGDVNGDGYDDLIAGADQANKGIYDTAGRVYIWYGHGNGIINGSNADVILENLVDEDDRLGYAVGAGDLDGDGYDDVVGGAPYANKTSTIPETPPRDYSGRAYIWYGSASGIPNASLPDVTLENLMDESSEFGNSIGIGDVDGDGYADLFVGAVTAYRQSDGSGIGRVYGWYGKTEGIQNASSPDLIFENIQGVEPTSFGSGQLGASVDVGDVNGDGFADLAAGANFADNGDKDMAGRVYIWYGAKTGMINGSEPDVTLEDLTAVNRGGTADYFGSDVVLGDINGDGYLDLLASASTAEDNASNYARVYGWYGNSSGIINGSEPDITLGDQLPFGQSIGIGHVRGTIYGDVIIGAYSYYYANYTFGVLYMWYEETAPTVILEVPDNDAYNTTTNTIDFTYNVTDDGTITRCDLTIDNSINATSTSVQTGTPGQNITTYLPNGDYLWNISCTDNSNNTATSETRNISINVAPDTTAPTVTLEAPDDNATNTTTNTIDFTYNVSDVSSLDNCSLIINDEINVTDTAMVKDTAGQNFTVYLDNAEYNWSVNCTDSSNNIGASETRNLSINYTAAPSISVTDVQIIPSKAANSTIINVTAQVNVTGGTVTSVNALFYYVNGLNFENRTMSDSGGGLYYNDTYIADFLVPGTYNVTIYATDSNSNVNDSEKATFTPYLALTNYTNIGINGAFADWGGITNYTDSLSSINASSVQQNVTLRLPYIADYSGVDTAVGDFNKDGNKDLVVANSYYHEVYLWFGNSSNMTNQTGPDLTFTYEDSASCNNAAFGGTVVVGDFNGDGNDDLAISATEYSQLQVDYTGDCPNIVPENCTCDNGGDVSLSDIRREGRVYIYYGSGTTIDTTADVRIDSPDCACNPTQPDPPMTTDCYCNFGISIAAGDINNDTNDDLIIGEDAKYDGSVGAVLVYRTTNEGVITADYATLPGTGSSDQFGLVVRSDDLNNDSYYEVIVTSPWFDSSQGGVYVWYGKQQNITSSDLPNVTLRGPTYSRLGDDLVTGDFNADGYPDMAVGADAYLNSAGRVYIWYSNSNILNNNSEANLTIDNPVDPPNDYFSYYTPSMAAGDFNRDGYADLFVGAYGIDYPAPESGMIFAFYGSSNGIDETNISAIMNTTAEKDIYGDTPFGTSVTLADMNGDTTPEVIAIVPSEAYIFNQVAPFSFVRGYFDMMGYTLANNDTTLFAQISLNKSLNFEKYYDYYSMYISINDDSGNDTSPRSGAELPFNYTYQVNITNNACGFYNRTTYIGQCYYNNDTVNVEIGIPLSLMGITTGDSINVTFETGRDGPYDSYSYDFAPDSTSFISYTLEAAAADTTAPTITVEAPDNDAYNTTTNTIDFTYNVTDDGTLNNCSLIINDEINVTDTTMLKDAAGQNLTVYLDNADYNWSVNCTDNNNNIGNSSTRNISVNYVAEETPADNTTIYLQYPDDSVTNTTSRHPDFTFNFTSNQTALNCSVWLNNSGTNFVYKLNSTTLNATSTTLRNENIYLSDTSYTWWVNCTDGSTTWGSETRTLTINVDNIKAIGNGTEPNVTLENLQFDNSYFGYSVYGADLNGDGYLDLISGAYLADKGAYVNAGRVYVWYGTSAGITNGSDPDVTLENLQDDNSNLGYSVSGGDVNGDGYDDLIAGARYGNKDSRDSSGRVYIWYGSPSGINNGSEPNVTLENIEDCNANLGNAVTVGDVNGDGYDDVIAGARGRPVDSSPTSPLSGRVYVWYGSGSGITNGTAPDVTLDDIQNDGSQLGKSVSAGDLNGDGYSDVIAGAYFANKSDVYNSAGRVYAWYGNSTGITNGSLPDLTLENLQDDNSLFGASVGVGDFNSDGFGDLIAGATWANKSDVDDSGRVYIWHGNGTGIVNGSEPDIILEHIQDFDYTEFGSSVSGGDFNGDGIEDLAAGAWWAQNDYGYAGRIYGWYGSASGITNGSNPDIILENLQNDGSELGVSVFVGDFNNDLHDEIAAGAYLANKNSSNAGRTYVWTFDQTPVITLEDPANNAYNSTTNTIDFTYNVSDDGPISNCTLIINDEINITSTGTARDTAGLNITTYLPNGDYLWSINCTDNNNNIGASETRNLSVNYVVSDTTAPTVTLELPDDSSTNITTNTIDFTYNVTDDGTLANCTLIIDYEGINVTDTGMSKDTAGQNLTMNLNNGNYNWSVNCTDENNNIGASEVRNLTVNYITCNSCENCTALIIAANAGDTITLLNNITNRTGSCISFSGADNITFDCDRYTIEGDDTGSAYDYGININSSAENNTLKNCIVTDFSYGIYVEGYSLSNTIQDSTSDSNENGGIFVEGGSNSTQISNVTTRQNTIRGIDVRSSYCVIESSVSENNLNEGLILLGPDNLVINLTSTSNNYGISINEYATGSNITNSTIENNTIRGIYIYLAGDYGIIHNNIIRNNTINAYAEIGTLDYWNSTKTTGENIIGGPNIGGNYWNDYNGSDDNNDGIGEEPYYISGTGMDYLPLTTQGATPPTVNLEAPDDNTTNTTTNIIDFTYNVTENYTLSNCSLIINDEINATDTAMLKDTTGQNFTVYLDNGDYNWSVNCTDTSNNIGSSETWNLTVNDTTAPTINLESPTDGTTWTSSSTVNFYYNVTDGGTLSNCTLILNYDDVNSTSTAMIKDAAGQNFTSTLANGAYNWSVNCTDVSNNIGTGEVWNLTVSYSPPEEPGGGGGGKPPEAPPVVPPETPPVPPAPPAPPAPPVTPPVTPPEEIPGEGGRREEGRSNARECWSPSGSLTPGEIDSLSYLLDMIPCPDVVAVEAKNVKKKTWCNGIEIDIEDLAALRVGFIRGKTQYNLNFGSQTEEWTYCPWCNNGIKDYDEEGVDCGGPSCPPCIKIEKPAITIELKCGDKKCQEGNEYACPEDCRDLNWTILLIILLLIALLINTSLWRYYKKKGKLTKNKNIIFALNTTVIAGALIYVITQYICVSPIECEMFIIILVLAAITTGLFLLVFKGMVVIEKTKAITGYLVAPSQTGLAIKEIRSLTRKAEENLKKGDLEAAEILYEAIEPIYDSLEERQKRRVIGDIRKMYHELTTQKDGKDLNMRENIENKEKEGF